ncbi:hypothetical protein [Streptomyces sp. NPDC051183]|uniref:hypothetical protein n=1 Tax=Streptomyces sp. NPDC051183 TaxID=3155165 RepID=UPI003417EE77
MWLERPGPPSPLDEVLLDRLSIATAAAVERYGPARTTMADPALVELVISSDSDEAARARALRLLGFAADLPVRVVAVRSRLPLDRIGGLVCPARPVKAASVADVGVILATTVDPARFPAGVRAGIGAAARPAPCAWASPSPPPPRCHRSPPAATCSRTPTAGPSTSTRPEHRGLAGLLRRRRSGTAYLPGMYAKVRPRTVFRREIALDGPEPDAPDESPAAEPPPESPEEPGNGSRSLPWWLGLLAVAGPLLSAGLGPLLQLFGIESGPVGAALLLLAVLIGGIVAVRMTFADRPKMSRRARRLSVAGLVGFLGVCIALVIVFQPSPPPPELPRLPGGQDVAVVGFEGVGAGHDQQVLDDVSEVFTADLMKDKLPEGSRAHDYARLISPPLEVLGRAGQDHQELDDWTNRFVERTNAGIVIGGLVATDSAGQTELRPAVYVRAAQVADAPELAGWYLSGPIRLDQDWSSDTGRRHVISELVRRTRGLAGFTHALDLWRNGEVDEAKRELDRLLPAGTGTTRQDGAEFVTTDLVRLFRGHVLEQVAFGLPAAQRKPYLEAARADYRAIDPNGRIALRARLSLAGAQYQLALGPSPSCRPGTVDAAALTASSAELRRLAADGLFSEVGRLRASVNLAQVEQCRVTARIVPDDGTIEEALQRVRSAEGGRTVKDLQTLAASVAAVHAFGRGDLAAAISFIKEAIAGERGFARRGLWQALAASWEFQRGDTDSGCRDMRAALDQLGAARAKGEITSQRYEELKNSLQQEAKGAGARCPDASPAG